MKRLICLVLLVNIFGRLSAQPPGSLSGTVTDSLTGRPLAGVSVFLNNTSRGTVTRSDGVFHLAIPPGDWQLVFSAIGYATVITGVNNSRQHDPLNIRLRQRAAELEAVTVKPYEKRGWGKYGKFFWNNFIGTGVNAASCTILNREVLRFHFYKRSNRLSVTATEPLQIENDALGYILEYKLEEFVSDFDANIVSWQGYPFFREKQARNEERKQAWIRNRRATYQGSMMHFMRSLYSGHTISESFLVQRDVIVPNMEKRRVKDIYRPDFQKPGLFPMDTLYYFWEVLRQPDPIHRRIVVSPDTLILPQDDPTRGLYFDGTLIVSYGVNNRTDSFRQSGIRLLSAKPVTIEANGSYFPGKEIIRTGYWGQTEKLCNLLPLDYVLPPPESRPVLH